MTGRSASGAGSRAGVAFACACAVFSASAILLGKTVLGELTPLQLVTCVYTCSAVYFLCHRLLWAGRGAPRITLTLAAMRSSIWIGAFDLIYNVALFSALRTMTSPEHGFCSLLSEVVTIVMGIVFLRERYTIREGVWIVLIAGGIVIVQFQPVGLNGDGLAWIALAAFAAGSRSILAKRALDARTPAEIALVRTTIVACALVLYSLVTGTWTTPSPRILGSVLAMALVGPFLNTLCFYHALQRLRLGRVVMLRMGYVILIPIGAFAIHGQGMSGRDLAGGAAILVGTILLVREKERLARGA
ncbi:MAG: DMT family transporter [Myxococcales bacterium]|nr:DMT family transporter [Myxococcales bacterium]